MVYVVPMTVQNRCLVWTAQRKEEEGLTEEKAQPGQRPHGCILAGSEADGTEDPPWQRKEKPDLKCVCESQGERLTAHSQQREETTKEQSTGNHL